MKKKPTWLESMNHYVTEINIWMNNLVYKIDNPDIPKTFWERYKVEVYTLLFFLWMGIMFYLMNWPPGVRLSIWLFGLRILMTVINTISYTWKKWRGKL